jgi:hypothetical protein
MTMGDSMDAGTEALAVAHTYHDAWTTRRFDDAVRLLAPTLRVEVPINSYPTVASFAYALAKFGRLVQRVTLLTALGGLNEAMLLYDMEVDGLGSMRVAEHFTVAEGRIVLLRQIHDTAALSAAGSVRVTDTGRDV